MSIERDHIFTLDPDRLAISTEIRHPLFHKPEPVPDSRIDLAALLRLVGIMADGIPGNTTGLPEADLAALREWVALPGNLPRLVHMAGRYAVETIARELQDADSRKEHARMWEALLRWVYSDETEFRAGLLIVRHPELSKRACARKLGWTHSKFERAERRARMRFPGFDGMLHNRGLMAAKQRERREKEGADRPMPKIHDRKPEPMPWTLPGFSCTCEAARVRETLKRFLDRFLAPYLGWETPVPPSPYGSSQALRARRLVRAPRKNAQAPGDSVSQLLIPARHTEMKLAGWDGMTSCPCGKCPRYEPAPEDEPHDLELFTLDLFNPAESPSGQWEWRLSRRCVHTGAKAARRRLTARPPPPVDPGGHAGT